MEETNESKEFWQEKERETGRPIIFRSFARFIGEGGKLYNLSGLLFSTDERVYFEDFEKSTFFDFFMKKKNKYEKFTMNFQISDALSMHKVSENSAIAFINGEIEKAKSPNMLMSFFSSTAWEICFKNGGCYFFELFEPGKLTELISDK